MEIPSEPRRGRVITKLPKDGMRSIPGTYIAGSTSRSIFRTPVQAIAQWQARKASRQVAKFLCTACPNGYGRIGGSHRLENWTDGCVAVSNQEIDEIWMAVDDRNPDRDPSLSSEFPKDHCPSDTKITDSVLPPDSPIWCRFCRGSSPGIKNLGKMTEEGRSC